MARMYVYIPRFCVNELDLYDIIHISMFSVMRLQGFEDDHINES